MRLGIMQPYFMPYLGYFSLLVATDQFVIFDPVQYIRHGWVNRNRILRPDGKGTQYINVPLAKHSRDTLIRDIRIASSTDWKKRILGQLEHYRKKSNHFQATRDIVAECLAIETDSLVELNVHCLRTLCRALDFEFNDTRYDEIENDVKPAAHAGDWALQISVALKATSYLNPIGGRELFSADEFERERVELAFLKNDLKMYDQCVPEFEAGLSIIDVLMFTGIDETKLRVKEYSIEPAK